MTLTKLICTYANGRSYCDRDTPANRRKHARLRAKHDCVTRIGTNDGFMFVVDEMLYSRQRAVRMQEKANAELAKARSLGFKYSIERAERQKRSADAIIAALEQEAAS